MTSLSPLQPQKGRRHKKKADVPPAVPAKGKDLDCDFLSKATLVDAGLESNVGLGQRNRWMDGGGGTYHSVLLWCTISPTRLCT